MSSEKKMITDKELRDRINVLSSRVVANKRSATYDEERNASSSKDLNPPSLLKQMSELAVSREAAADTILKTTPDTARAIGILTGMAVCPAGGTRASLQFNLGSKTNSVDDATGNLHIIATELADFFTNVIDIESNQYRKLYDILSTKGAVVTAIIPDSKMDTIINSSELAGGISLESLTAGRVFKRTNGKIELPSLGFLSNSKASKAKEEDNTALESVFKTTNNQSSYNSTAVKMGTKTLIEIIDNPDILKLPSVVELNTNAERNRRINSYSTHALESDKLHPNYYLKRKYKVSKLVALTDAARYEGTRRPHLIDIPANVFLPIYYPNDPSRRYGGFVLLDSTGNPLAIDKGDDAYTQLINANTGNTTDNQLTKIHNLTVGNSASGTFKSDGGNEANFKLFQELLERDLHERLAGDGNLNGYRLADESVFYKIMFSRALANKETKVLFLPDSMVCYQAVHLDEHGMGVSLVARNRLIATLRTVLFYSNFMNALSNSLSKKKATIKLDPNDRNLSKTLEKTLNTLVETQAGVSDTLRASGPTNIIEALQKISMSVNLEDSDIPGQPNTKISLEDEKRNIQPVDSTYMEELRRLQMMDYTISPEIIDNSFSPQFAAQVYRENDITDRMVSEIVDAVANYNTEFVVKYTRNDPVLVESIIPLLKIKGIKKEDNEEIEPVTVPKPEDESAPANIVSGAKDYDQRLGWVERALEVLWVTPPLPDMDGLEHSKEDFDKFTTMLDTVLDSRFKDNFGRGLSGEMGEALEFLRAALKQRYISSYLRRSNMLPELRNELTNDESLKEAIRDELDSLGHMFPVLEETVAMMAKAGVIGSRTNSMTEEEINQEFDARQQELDAAEAELEETTNGVEEPTEDEEIINTPEEPTEEPTDGAAEEEPVVDGEEEPAVDEEGAAEGDDDEINFDDLAI